MAFNYIAAEEALQEYDAAISDLQALPEFDDTTYELAISALARLVRHLDIDLDEYVDEANGNTFLDELAAIAISGEIEDIDDEINYDLLNDYNARLDVEFRKSFDDGPASVDLVGAIWFNAAVLTVLCDTSALDPVALFENEGFTRH